MVALGPNFRTYRKLLFCCLMQVLSSGQFSLSLAAPLLFQMCAKLDVSTVLLLFHSLSHCPPPLHSLSHPLFSLLTSLKFLPPTSPLLARISTCLSLSPPLLHSNSFLHASQLPPPSTLASLSPPFSVPPPTFPLAPL